MDSNLMVGALIVAAVLGWLLTWAMRGYALSRQIMDVPNCRSSHVRPTPRGGGVAFVATFLGVALWFFLAGQVTNEFFWMLAGAGFLVSLTGFLDDHGHIKARWRLLAHGLAAVWVLAMSQFIPTLRVFGFYFESQWILAVIWVLFMVWMLNLYNFMDGIDGLAASQAIFVAGGGALLYWLAGYQEYAWLPLLLSASVLGFLFWNFPPAKIFMGDAGSGFLGMTLAVFSIQAAQLDMRFFWAWLILSGVFIVDATLTLVRRVLNGGKAFQAHRTHAYQYASRRFGSHRAVTLSVVLLNVLLLLPIAMLVAMSMLAGEPALVLTYALLVLLAIYFKAGKTEIEDASL